MRRPFRQAVRVTGVFGRLAVLGPVRGMPTTTSARASSRRRAGKRTLGGRPPCEKRRRAAGRQAQARPARHHAPRKGGAQTGDAVTTAIVTSGQPRTHDPGHGSNWTAPLPGRTGPWRPLGTVRHISGRYGRCDKAAAIARAHVEGAPPQGALPRSELSILTSKRVRRARIPERLDVDDFWFVL